MGAGWGLGLGGWARGWFTCDVLGRAQRGDDTVSGAMPVRLEQNPSRPTRPPAPACTHLSGSPDSSAGEEISLADAALFPTFVFFTGACALALQPGRRVQYIPHLSWPLHLFKAERRVRGMEAPLQLTAAT